MTPQSFSATKIRNKTNVPLLLRNHVAWLCFWLPVVSALGA